MRFCLEVLPLARAVPGEPAPLVGCSVMIRREHRLCSRWAWAEIEGVPMCTEHHRQLERTVLSHIQVAIDRAREAHVCSPESLLAKQRDQSVIYYLQRADDLIKIGYSCRLKTRISTLQQVHGSLTLLATHPGYRSAERALHQRFADDRVEGEWFLPSDDLLAHIALVNRRAEKRAA